MPQWRPRGFFPSDATGYSRRHRTRRGCRPSDGAAELHIHVRDETGRETLRPEIVDITIEKLRRACPGTLIGIRTGEWIEKEDSRRDFMRNWSVLPDYGSVNLVDVDCAAVIENLKKRGVGIEAGIWTATDAARCLELNLATDSLRLLFEINQQDKAEALFELAAIEKNAGGGGAPEARAVARLRYHCLDVRGDRLRTRLFDQEWFGGWPRIARRPDCAVKRGARRRRDRAKT